MGNKSLDECVENVTDRVSNPFGMRPPAEYVPETGPQAVFGYGDANADFHLIGEYPGVHGGETTGVPFTEAPGTERVQRVLHEVGFLAEPYADEPDMENLFASYLCMCRVTPDDRVYDDLERYFDAELRAINAHILMPVGARAIDQVLEGYTTQRDKLAPVDEDALHATEVRGRGFLVVPIKDPAEWTDLDEQALEDRLRAILNSDYRQTKGVATLVG